MLNPDIDTIIFNGLSITDKRSYLRTCKTINLLSIQMPELEARFHRMLNDINFVYGPYYSGFTYPLYKFTIELIFDNHPIPDKYIIPENRILYQYPEIYKILVERGYTPTVIKMLNLNRNGSHKGNIDLAMFGAAKVGNIKFLRYLRKRGYSFGRMSTSAAAKAGDLKTLKWLIKYGAELDDSIVTLAAIGGHIKVLKYLIIDKECSIEDASYYAAEEGKFETVKYLHSVYPESLVHAIPGAASGGHIEILKFAFSHGYDVLGSFWSEHIHIWKWLIENNHFKYNIETIQNIAWSGNLESLQYIHSKGFNVIDTRVFERAIYGKNIEMVRWLDDMKCDKKSQEEIFSAALETPPVKSGGYTTGGSLPILKLLVNWGYDLINSSCILPAYYGDLDILQYQYAHGCKLDKKVINYAATNGHLHIIIWCRKQGCDWDTKACQNTVFWNHLNVLKWLRGVDRDKCGLESDETEICPWDDNIFLSAIQTDSIDILAFALSNGCEFTPRCYEAVIKSGNTDMINCVTKHYNI